MKRIAYSSPFVPPELIAAHGLDPWLVEPADVSTENESLPLAGVCPYVQAFLAEALRHPETAAIVLATTCDQMRRAGDIIRMDGRVPLFVLNVPRTWKTPAVREVYRQELLRLSRFLVEIGRREPSQEQLAETLLRYDDCRPRLTVSSASDRDTAVPLAVLGGPLRRGDRAIFDLIRQAGGAVVLDATENGERTLPAPFDAAAVRDDPFAELVRAYFDTIPDAFRRPNSLLYDWLHDTLTGRGVRGLILFRHLWCDIWLAEVGRLRESLGIPLLDLEAGNGGSEHRPAWSTRIQAFLEALR